MGRCAGGDFASLTGTGRCFPLFRGAARAMFKRRWGATRAGVTGFGEGRVARITKRSWGEQVERLLRYRVLIPIKRSRHTPEHTARGVMVGVIWALTPTMGVQMAIVLLTWLISRHLFRWDFNVIIGFAWTWISNPVTMIPIYYVFYVTGQFLLGRWDDLLGYESFQTLSQELRDAAFFEAIRIYFSTIVWGWGSAMVVGCIPYAAVGGFLGYRWGVKFVVRYRVARELRRRRKELRRGPQPRPDAAGIRGEPSA